MFSSQVAVCHVGLIKLGSGNSTGLNGLNDQSKYLKDKSLHAYIYRTLPVYVNKTDDPLMILLTKFGF